MRGEGMGEVEELAMEIIESGIDTAHDGWCRDERITLARFVLAVMPLVKAALIWNDDTPGPTFKEHAEQFAKNERDLVRAIDAFTATEAGGEK
jgi:hypothetical protein